jgi:hypothetical protein
VILHVYGGLGNRIRAILSRLSPIESLTVVWEPTEEIAFGRWSDVFAPLDGVTFHEEPISGALRTCDPHWHPHDEWDRPSWLAHYARLSPLHPIMGRIEALQMSINSDYDAMHIRRTDHIDLAKSEGGWTPDERFHAFTQDTSGPMYLATDNGRTQRAVKDWIGHRLVTNTWMPDTAGDGSCHRFTTLAEAVVDAWVCAGARRFMPSGSSSFSQLVKYLREIRHLESHHAH